MEVRNRKVYFTNLTYRPYPVNNSMLGIEGQVLDPNDYVL